MLTCAFHDMDTESWLKEHINRMFGKDFDTIEKIVNEYAKDDLMGIAYLSYSLGVAASVGAYAKTIEKEKHEIFGV